MRWLGEEKENNKNNTNEVMEYEKGREKCATDENEGKRTEEQET